MTMTNLTIAMLMVLEELRDQAQYVADKSASRPKRRAELVKALKKLDAAKRLLIDAGKLVEVKQSSLGK
jgi:hypothetical protein